MLKHTIASDLKDAMKSGDATKRSTLRMLISAIHNKEIEKEKKEEGLSDEEVIQVVRSEAKKRRDAAAEFTVAGRQELARKEEEEAILLGAYLPPELSQENLNQVVLQAIKETGAISAKDFGKVMKLVLATTKGQVSGERVSAAVKNALN